MSWISRPLGIVAMGALMAVPALAGHHGGSRVVVAPRVVVGRPVVVRPRAYVYYGPSLYYSPYYYPYSYSYYGYAPAYAVGPGTGQVKIESHLKDATIYVDGGYVGPVSRFKRFGLRPGNHDIEMRDVTGRLVFNERVQVLVDRTVEIHSPV
jgi:hypothetical protein